MSDVTRYKLELTIGTLERDPDGDYVEYSDYESLQSQLAAANEQIRRLWPAKLSAAPCSICGYNGPGYYQAETHPCAAQKADAAAPVPSQPAVVQDAVVRALIEAAQMAVEMIETEKHERRHVRWALKDALLAAKPADTEGRKDE